jgi:hypothetical protein
MRRAFVCLLALGCLAAAATARAQEPADQELDFVRKLRAKGYHDFARQRLEMLAKRNDPKLVSIVPLEQARTVLAEAREKDPSQRFGLFDQARAFLKDYTAKNDGKPEAAQGTLELARLSTYEGEALLTKALRELDPAVQQDLARPAEAKFKLATGELTQAIKLLKSLIDGPQTTDSVKKQLRQDLTQAQFDKGTNFLNQARTYVNTTKEDLNLQRAQIVQEAKAVFDTLKEDDTLAIRSQANAWLMKIAMESTDPGKTEYYYERVMASKSPEARAGQRWARLFDMQEVLAGRSPRAAKLKAANERLVLVEKMALSWLKDYTANIRSSEGDGVLWELGNAYYLQAKEAEKDTKVKIAPDKVAARAAPFYANAQKYFTILAQGEGDYSEKANKANLSISFHLMGKRTDFRTFDELYLKGQFELMELQDLGAKRAKAPDAKEAEKFDVAWHAKLKQIPRTFSRALALANSRTPIAKLDEARYYETATFLMSGDLYRAAVAGEALGRTRPPTRRAPSGAGYAIDAYATLLNTQYSDATRERLDDLIKFVLAKDNQKFWSADPVTGVAIYQRAMLAKRDGDYKGAIAELERLPRDFRGYIYAQGQLVFIALDTRRTNQNLSDKEKAELTEKVRQAVDRIPALPNEADSTTAYMYFLAKLEKAKILYSDGYRLLKEEPLKAGQKYKEMGKYLADLAASFDKLPIKLQQENRSRIDSELNVLRKYADLGQAEVQFREGKFEQVLKVTQPTLDAVKKRDGGKGGPIRMTDYQVSGEILGLALRADVQQGNIKGAKETLGLIKRLADEGDKVDSTVKDRAVSSLVAEISTYVKDLRQKGREKELATVTEKFSGFLSELLKDSDPKTMSVTERIVLARAFSGLELHEKAAELFEQVPPPTKLLESKTPFDKLTPAEKKELQDYWTLQWELVKELRRAKNYDKALAILDGTKDAPGWLKHPKALYAVPNGAMEKNFVLEDFGKYGPATMAWNAFMKTIQPKAGQDPQMRQLYFDAYFYSVRTLFKYAMNDPAVKNKGKLIDAAAKRIVDLQYNNRDAWGRVSERFEELLQQEPVLKESYDRLKKGRDGAQK